MDGGKLLAADNIKIVSRIQRGKHLQARCGAKKLREVELNSPCIVEGWVTWPGTDVPQGWKEWNPCSVGVVAK